MITNKNKNKKGSREDIFLSIFLSALVLGTIGFLFVSNWRVRQKRTELYERINELQGEIQELEGRKQQLLQNISEGSQESYLEKEARERLGLKKPGEEVVVIKRETEQEREEKKETFWEKAAQQTSSIKKGAADFFSKLKFW